MGAFLTDPRCIRQRNFINLPAWSKYTGKGLVIFHDDIKPVHNDAIVDMYKTEFPDAKVLSGHIDSNTKSGAVTSCTVRCNETKEALPFDQFITKHGVKVINNSTEGGRGNPNSPIAKYMLEKIKQYNLFCTGAAGNFGDDINPYLGAFIMVSGVQFYKNTDRIMKYGVSYDGIDFAMFMGFQDGTSFASPFLSIAGCKLICHYGFDITQEWIYEYLKGHCNNLGIAEKNEMYGWGVPILGNPVKIVMPVGSKYITINDIDVSIDQPAVIDRVTNRTLAPVRTVAEALGAVVNYNAATKTVIISGEDVKKVE